MYNNQNNKLISIQFNSKWSSKTKKIGNKLFDKFRLDCFIIEENYANDKYLQKNSLKKIKSHLGLI